MAPTQSDTRPARTLNGYHWAQSREPRPSVAREYTHHRPSAHGRVGTAHRFTAGMTRQRGYLHDPESGGCKAVVGSHVTRNRETNPYPGLELITPAGDTARHPLCFTDLSVSRGVLRASLTQALATTIEILRFTSWRSEHQTTEGNSSQTNNGAGCSRADRLRTRTTRLSRRMPSPLSMRLCAMWAAVPANPYYMGVAS